MAGNTRGKLKEQVEGLHNNFDAAKRHSAQAILLLGDAHPELVAMFTSVVSAMETMDELTADIYSRL